MKPCCFCGKRLTRKQKAKCQARGTICKSCGKKGSFAKCCNSTQVANVEQRELDKEDNNFLDAENDEIYLVLKTSKLSIQTKVFKSLDVSNSATDNTKFLRATLKS